MSLIQRFWGLDALRGLAVVLMVSTHTYKRYFFTNQKPFYDSVPTHLFDQIPYYLLSFEPIIAPLFLVLTGFCFVYFRELREIEGLKELRFWNKRHLLMISKLALGAIILFFLESGVQWPDILFIPGILMLIALVHVMLLLSYSFFEKNIFPFLSFLFVTGSLFFILFSKYEISLRGVSCGPAPFFPLSMIAVWGGILAYAIAHGKKIFLWITALVTFLVYPWVFYEGIPPLSQTFLTTYKLFSPFLEKAGGPFYILGVIEGQGLYDIDVGFWQYTDKAFLLSLFPLQLLLIFLLKAENMMKSIIFRPLVHIGQKALPCYFVHLLFLMILCWLSGFPSTIDKSFFLLLFLELSLWAISYALLRKQGVKKI